MVDLVKVKKKPGTLNFSGNPPPLVNLIHIYIYILELQGPMAPAVLAPAESMGALQAPCQVWVILFYFIFF